MLSKYTNPPTTNVDSSKGTYGLSYKSIFTKVNQIIRSDNPIMTAHIKAARLLYIVHGIRVKDNQFQIIPLGNLDLMVVHDAMENANSGMILDIAQLGDRDLIFVFRDNLVSEYISTADRFSNLYSLYNALVAIFVKQSLCVLYDSIYSTIARYAPYALTVKTMGRLGINIKIGDIDFYTLPEDDTRFMNDTTLDIIKNSTEEDLFSYGVLCEYIRQ